MVDVMLHVYAVVPAAAPLPALHGVGDPDEPLRLVVEQDLAAVVSAVDDPAALTEDDAVHHYDVLAALAAETTVLPMRFGTAAPDDAAVRGEVLAEGADDLRDGLAALDGMVELRVDLAFDEQQVLRAVVSAHPELTGLDGRAGDLEHRLRIGEAVSHEVQAWTQDRGDQLMAHPVALARRAFRLASDDAFVDRWALLVARDRVSEVDDAVAAIRQRDDGVWVEYVGPLAPAHFLDEPPGEAASGSRWGW